jgi:hypothetical protein
VKRVDRTAIPNRALQLKFKDSFKQVLEDVKKRGMSWQEIEGERLWKERQNLRLFSHGLV